MKHNAWTLREVSGSVKFCCIDNDLFAKYSDCMDELEPLKSYGEFYNGKADATDEEKIALASDCEVVFFGSTYLSQKIISNLNRLRVLQFFGTGIANYVDVNFCESRGIKVLNVEEYGSNAVAEYAIAMIFSCIRNIPKSDNRMKSQKWCYDNLEGIEIQGSVVGILGTGKIGYKVIEKLSALGVKKIYAFDIFENNELSTRFNVEYCDLEKIFRESDIISIHLKYSEETYGIVSKALIDQMKKDAFLINTARAELVDYAALGKAVKEKRIRGAAIDVYYQEPVEDFSICMDENIVATTHMGFFTRNAKRNLLRNAVKSVITNIDYAKN